MWSRPMVYQLSWVRDRSQFKFLEVCFWAYAETRDNTNSFRPFAEHRNCNKTHLIFMLIELTPFGSLHIVFCYHPVVTLTLKCTVFEIWRHIERKLPFSTTPLSFDAPCPAIRLKYPHKPYVARNFDLWCTFLPLIIWVYFHSYFSGELQKTHV